jgi:hypothetical protein
MCDVLCGMPVLSNQRLKLNIIESTMPMRSASFHRSTALSSWMMQGPGFQPFAS